MEATAFFAASSKSFVDSMLHPDSASMRFASSTFVPEKRKKEQIDTCA